MTGQTGWESFNPLTISQFLFISLSSPSLSFLHRAEMSLSRRRPSHRSPYSGHRSSIPSTSTFLTLSSPSPAPPQASLELSPPESALHRRPPWERRPSSTPSRRSASSVLLHSNRPQGWVLGELLHLPRFFPTLFPKLPRRSAATRRTRAAAPPRSGLSGLVSDHPTQHSF